MAIEYLGNGGQGSGTGTVTYNIPSGTQIGDLLLLVMETANQTVTEPGAWLDVPNSPQGVGTAGGTAATRLKIMYRWVDGTSITTTVSDPGNHQVGTILAFRGVDEVSPFNTSAGSVKTTANTTLAFPVVTTTVNDCWVLFMEARALPDSNTNSQTGAGLTVNAVGSRTYEGILAEFNTNAGNGGGFSVRADSTTGTVAYTSASTTYNTSTVSAHITLALRPPPRQLTLDSTPNQTYTATGTETGVLADRLLSGDAQAVTSTTFAAALSKGVVVTADQQSFAAVTTDTGVRAARRLTADTASVAATTTDTVLLATRRLTADTRIYTATAFDATLIWFDITELFVAADAQSYTVTANAATVKADRKLTADAQNYTVTTVNAGRNLSLRADGAAVTVTTVDNVISTGLILRADSATYATTTVPANTIAARRLVADQATASVTTVPAGVVAQRRLAADVRSFAYAPVAAGVLFGRSLAANQASYTLTRVDSWLRAIRYLAANDASFAVTGVDIDLNSGNVLRATTAAYTTTRQPANVLFGRRLTTQTTAFGSASFIDPDYVEEGYFGPESAELRVTRRLTADRRVFSASGVQAILKRQYTLLSESQIYVINTINAGRNLSIVMDAGSVVVATSPIDISYSKRFRLQTTPFSVQTYQSGVVFSNLPAAEFVAYRPLELNAATRPSESVVAIRPEDAYAAERPFEARTGTYA